jgi:hypothetical protein
MDNLRLDYTAFHNGSPLRQSVAESITSLKQFFKNNRTGVRVYFGFGIFSVFALFAVANIVFFIKYREDPLPVALLAMTAFDALYVGLIIHGFIGYGKRAVIVRNFCEANNFEFQKTVNTYHEKSRLLNSSIEKYARNGILSTDKKNPNNAFMIFDYRYRTGSGRHPSVNFFNVVLANLNKATPPILAVHKKSLNRFHLSDCSENFTLNNELDSQFKFYGSPKAKDTLTKVINSPAIQKLLETFKSCDIEISNQRIYLFIHGNYRKPERLELLIRAAQNIQL